MANCALLAIGINFYTKVHDINLFLLECESVNDSGYLSFEDNSLSVNESGNGEQDIYTH